MIINSKIKDREIIDFETKGNVIRFYLGKNKEQWGDDWDDTPYEHNAGTVYDEFVGSIEDIYVNFDCLVLQPCDGAYNSNSHYSKQHMINCHVPCIIIVPSEIISYDYWNNRFDYWVGNKDVIKIYFGDNIDQLIATYAERNTAEIISFKGGIYK